MKKETKETTPKQRIVVLEKGKAIEVNSEWLLCCYTTLFPIRG